MLKRGTMVSSLDGIIQIAVVFLSVVAGGIAISLFRTSHTMSYLKPWRPLIIGLVLFAVEEILGALAAFNIYRSPFLTHVIPSAILIILMYALFLQILEAQKWRM
ncbi:MAG TPA: hypothetical protein VJC16_01825 [Candidatus Nanoarchaeia archaeon]|nr:hypothetical protein [Candidatus Nanoarchaeia archaeon]